VILLKCGIVFINGILFCITYTRIDVLIHVFLLCLYSVQGNLNANTDKGRTGLRNLGNTVRMHLLSVSKS